MFCAHNEWTLLWKKLRKPTCVMSGKIDKRLNSSTTFACSVISLSRLARLRCDPYAFSMIGGNNSGAVFTRIGSSELSTEKKDQ
jgi:hypothetical protein